MCCMRKTFIIYPPLIRLCAISLQATTRKYRRHLSSHHLAPQLDLSTSGMVLYISGFAETVKILNVAMSLGKTPIIRMPFHQILKSRIHWQTLNYIKLCPG